MYGKPDKSGHSSIPTVRSLTRVKCPGIARGGWAVLELTGTLYEQRLCIVSGDLIARNNTQSFSPYHTPKILKWYSMDI